MRAARWLQSLQARRQLRTAQGCQPCAKRWPQLYCLAVSSYTVSHVSPVYEMLYLHSPAESVHLGPLQIAAAPKGIKVATICFVFAGAELDAVSQLPITLLREVAGRPASQWPALLMDVATAAHLASRLADLLTQQKLAVAAADNLLSNSALASCSADATEHTEAHVLQARDQYTNS